MGMALLDTPAWVLLAPLALQVAAAYVSVWWHRDTDDFIKSVRMYIPLAALVVAVFSFLGLDWVLGAMMACACFSALMYFSNKLFYEHSDRN